MHRVLMHPMVVLPFTLVSSPLHGFRTLAVH
jgi:hypothetical protein